MLSNRAGKWLPTCEKCRSSYESIIIAYKKLICCGETTVSIRVWSIVFVFSRQLTKVVLPACMLFFSYYFQNIVSHTFVVNCEFFIPCHYFMQDNAGAIRGSAHETITENCSM